MPCLSQQWGVSFFTNEDKRLEFGQEQIEDNHFNPKSRLNFLTFQLSRHCKECMDIHGEERLGSSLAIHICYSIIYRITL